MSFDRPPPDLATASGVPSPSIATRANADATQTLWSDADLAAAAFHLKSLGLDESRCRRVLSAFAWRGVRRIRPYVLNITAADVDSWVSSTDGIVREPWRRGDVIVVRTPPRWPWRVST